MPAVLVSILMMLLSAWTILSAESIRFVKAQRLAALESGQALIASEAEQYFFETGAWPASLEALSAVPGYQHLKPYVSQLNGGTLSSPTSPWKLVPSNVLSDGSQRFQRLVVLAFKDGSVSLTDYLSAARNRCNPSGGTQPFSSAVEWCGEPSQLWTLRDSREMQAARDRVAYRNQAATASKLVTRYKTTGNFPAAAAATNLYTLVTPVLGSTAPGATPASCKGLFAWNGIGLECADLYNVHGNPVQYRRITLKQFALTSASSVRNAAGTPLTLTTTITMP